MVTIRQGSLLRPSQQQLRTTHSVGPRPRALVPLTCLFGWVGREAGLGLVLPLGGEQAAQGWRVPGKGLRRSRDKREARWGPGDRQMRVGNRPGVHSSPPPTPSPTYPQRNAQNQHEVQNYHQDVQGTAGAKELSRPPEALPSGCHGGASQRLSTTG